MNVVLTLHDVRDVEAHVRALLDARLDEFGGQLDDAQYDDLLGFLIAECWELSVRYSDSFGLTFSTYSRGLLTLRVANWYRTTFRDTRYGAFLDVNTGKRLKSRDVDEATGEPCRTSRVCVLDVAHAGGCVIRIPTRRDEVSLDRGPDTGHEAADDGLADALAGAVGQQAHALVDPRTVDADEELLTTIAVGWR